MGKTYSKITKEERLSTLNAIASGMGGICLSKEYLSNHEKLEFQCQFGHRWWVSPANIKVGKWCPTCSKNKKLSIEYAQEMAEKMGGKCVSKEYKNSGSKLNWVCSEEHTFSASINNITQKGSWCPICSSSLYERMCRLFLEKLLSKTFNRFRPIWLVNSRGNKMELDGFNEELKVAFEYNGIQHYFFNQFFHKTEQYFWQQVNDDELKRTLCNNNGIKLIEIPTIESLDDFNQAENLILMQSIKYGLIKD